MFSPRNTEEVKASISITLDSLEMPRLLWHMSKENFQTFLDDKFVNITDSELVEH